MARGRHSTYTREDDDYDSDVLPVHKPASIRAGGAPAGSLVVCCLFGNPQLSIIQAAGGQEWRETDHHPCICICIIPSGPDLSI
ncbi:hypothetical protein DAI22_10g204850 [Oryza sativa Japonica Group]|nr:hypothetical protein DAI22_10g204850 [Oryza sativa Japonica Group]KAF2914976.1 hypothetical protein DAI22_10g204850 [Oryza sativa Japonica Group]